MSSSADGVVGSDESFIAFAFAIVSMIGMALYFPMIIRAVKDVTSFLVNLVSNETRKKYDDDHDGSDENPFIRFFKWCMTVPNMILFVALHPLAVVAGSKVLTSNFSLAWKITIPRTVRYIVRPRIIILWLWVFLFSSVMYQALTFDAHAILGLPNTASTSDIKKAYRALSKQYHPDQNTTSEARVIYNQVRKAYKSLVDRDAYEKEVAQETTDFSVGIALPKFLTSRDNDGLVLIIFLGLLLAIPLTLWYYLKGGDFLQNLQSQVKIVKDLQTLYEPLYRALGFPEDARYADRKRDRKELVQVLRSVGLAKKTDDEAMVEGFPSLADFRQKCLAVEKNHTALVNLGFDEQGISALEKYFQEARDNGDAKQPTEQQAFTRVSDDSRTAIVFFMTQITDDLTKACDELRGQCGRFMNEVRSIRKLLRHHEEVMDAIDRVYRAQKINPSDVQKVIDAVKNGDEIIRELPREIDAGLLKYSKYVQQQMEKQQRGGRR